MGKVKEGLRSLRFSRRIAGRAVDRKRGTLSAQNVESKIIRTAEKW